MYYYFAEFNKETLNIKREATEEEYNNIQSHVVKISKMMFDKNRIEPVLDAYNELISTIDNIPLKTNFNELNKVQSDLSQYLFSFKKFLDNWETEINRKFGKQSSEFQLFKNAQNTEYDKYMEYRIMYRLRNYDQHCGNIISKISRYIDKNGNPACKLLMDRDYLLENFHEWKQEEIEYLSNQSKYMKIDNFVYQLQNSILTIFEKTIQIHFNIDFFRSCAEIIKVANEFENENNIFIIKNEKELDKDFWEKPTIQLHFISLMVHNCKELLAMFFKNNHRVIKVLYYGEKYKCQLKNIGIEIDAEAAQKVINSQIINFQGQKMIRLLIKIELGNSNLYAVLADGGFKQKEISELCTDCSNFIKVLLKEK